MHFCIVFFCHFGTRVGGKKGSIEITGFEIRLGKGRITIKSEEKVDESGNAKM